MKLTIKAIVMYEHLIGAPYSEFSATEEELCTLLYCAQCCSGESRVTFEKFKETISLATKATEKLYKDIVRESQFITQFDKIKKEEEVECETEEQSDKHKSICVTDIAAILVVQGGLNPQFVYNDMELWMIPTFIDAISEKERKTLTNDRLWTYLSLFPRGSFKTPDDMWTFPWEKKEKKKKEAEELKDIELIAKEIEEYNKTITNKNNG